ncbi:unnamed protein product [Linum trigynum]|uniref:Uncharacterized protein n=1 Tax=Linum trigynum TaxID=586398 RepID=A0AAV2DCV2_9ROSI
MSNNTRNVGGSTRMKNYGLINNTSSFFEMGEDALRVSIGELPSLIPNLLRFATRSCSSTSSSGGASIRHFQKTVPISGRLPPGATSSQHVPLQTICI